MKTYLKILTHAGPTRRLSLLYVFTTLLAIGFGLVNLSLLIPLLEVLFSQTGGGTPVAPRSDFLISLTHLKALFNYHFIHIIATHGRISALYFVCIVMVISVLLANLFRYLAEIMAAELRVNVIHNLRSVLFDKISQLHMGYFTNQHKGDIIARTISDVQEVEHAMDYSFKIFFKEPATIIGFFIVLFYISPQLTWMALVALPVVGGSIIAIIRRLLQRAVQSQASLSRLTSILEETMEGMHIIKAFSVRTYIATKFEQENRTYAKLNLSMFLKTSLIPLLSAFLGVLVLTLLLAYGGKMVLSSESTFTASTFITYIIIFSQSLVPIKSISKSLSNIQRGLAAGKRIFSLAETQSAIINKPGSRTIKTLKRAITFKAVQFVYDHHPIIKDLNLTIGVKKKIAIVGPSGGGKSTISSLLSRLYDVTQGVIQIDGLPLQDYDIASIRKLIGIITQETMLFHDTVFNNIALGRPEASMSTVTEAARIADAHEFIQALPQGYQTIIGAGKSKLSSGQKQKIGIARGVLSKPSVLVLDEATSALDSTSAKLVQEAIDKLMQGKTLLVIAHRLNTIRNADEIFVIDAGEVAEHGTHKVLMQQEGLYKQLVHA
ncbi:MAG: ABC transporter ATP-binding protein [Bacteroidota bacterium]